MLKKIVKKNQLKKIILSLGTIASLITPIASVLACGPSFENGSDYEIMNYVDYISDYARNGIEEKYTYTPFGDLPEIKAAIREKKIAGAIGSDYFNAALAEQKQLQKIEFQRLFGKDNISFANQTLEKALRQIYTPEVFKVLDAFELKEIDANGNVINPILDIDNDGVQDKLWEFMVPYFSQNKVIAINISRLWNVADSAHKAKLKNAQNQFINQNEFETLIENELGSKAKTYGNIFDVLKAFGANKLSINDYMRDNLMIGSESIDDNTIINTPNTSNYQTMIKGFNTLISKFGSRTWNASGVESLDQIVNRSTNAQVAIIYNGDALYSNFGGSAGENGEKGFTRIITPKNSTFLLDGFIIPKYLEEDKREMNLLYDTISEYLYGGVSKKLVNIDDKTELNTFLNSAIYKNFDQVNYTPAYENLYKYVINDRGYFSDENNNIDENSRQIILSTENAGKTHVDFKNHVTGIISNNLENDIQIAYDNIKK